MRLAGHLGCQRSAHRKVKKADPSHRVVTSGDAGRVAAVPWLSPQRAKQGNTMPFDKVIFEPHGLYGADAKEILEDDEAEPFPFGYISTAQPTAPVFELNTVLSHPAEDLARLALAMAAAPELLDALKTIMSWIKNWDPNFADDDEWIDDARPKIEAAIAKAEGRRI